MAKSRCAKIRGILSVLFNHACRHELFDRNSIRLVRRGAKRRTTPSVLTPAERKALIGGLGLRERTLVLVAASTGLRQSELFGLKWGDINFAQGTMSVTRSVVYGVVGPCKTESSQKPVPVHPTVSEAFAKWREGSRFAKCDDWVLASRRHRGRKPIWSQAILRKYIRPVAQRLGIEKRFGWHTFRHYAEFRTMPSRTGISPILGRFEKCAHGIVFHLFDCAVWEWWALKRLSSLSRLGTTDRDKLYQSGPRAHSCGVKFAGTSWG